MKWLLLISSILFSTNAFTYPIPPYTLDELIQESDLIIRGLVIDDHHVIKDNNRLVEAIVSIEEIYLGENPNGILSIRYEPFMICPSPARYTKDKEVIAFVKLYKNQYWTVGLSYGTKYFKKKSDKDIFIDRMKTNIELRKKLSGERLTTALIDWNIHNLCISSLQRDAELNINRSLGECAEGTFEFNGKRKRHPLNNLEIEDFNTTQLAQLRSYILCEDARYLSSSWLSCIYDPYDKDFSRYCAQKLQQSYADSLFYSLHTKLYKFINVYDDIKETEFSKMLNQYRLSPYNERMSKSSFMKKTKNAFDRLVLDLYQVIDAY